jgi:hypothetical protein
MDDMKTSLCKFIGHLQKFTCIFLEICYILPMSILREGLEIFSEDHHILFGAR